GRLARPPRRWRARILLLLELRTNHAYYRLAIPQSSESGRLIHSFHPTVVPCHKPELRDLGARLRQKSTAFDEGTVAGFQSKSIRRSTRRQMKICDFQLAR